MGTAFSGVESARPLPVTGGRVRRGIPVLAALHGLGYALLVPFIFFICFTFLRPSPYDFFAIPAMALWFCLGIRLHRGVVIFVALLLLYHLGLLLALLPYFEEPRPVEWSYQSAYLMVTAIFFAMFFADDTRPGSSSCSRPMSQAASLPPVPGSQAISSSSAKACCSGWTGVPPACSKIRTCSAHS